MNLCVCIGKDTDKQKHRLNQAALKGTSFSSTCTALPLPSQELAPAAMLSGGVTLPSRYCLSSAVFFPQRLQEKTCCVTR